MSRGLVKHGRRAFWAAILALGFGGAASAGTVIVNANNSYNPPSSTGDFYTSNANISSSPGWKYDSVQGGATVGINTTYADYVVGNGSAYFNVQDGGEKAYVAYQPGTFLSPVSLGGTLRELSTLSYDVYRDSDSTSAGHYVPTIQLMLQKGFTSRTLVFEPVYDGRYGSTPLPMDRWNSINALNGGAGVFWSTTKISGDYKYWAMDGPAGQSWLELYGDYDVVGLRTTVGSGWSGTFIGGVDNLRIGFNGGEATTYNFEVNGAPVPPAPAVPEPSSVAMGLIAGAAGLVMAARRRRSA